MHALRTFRTLAVVATTALAVVAGGATAADAKPVRPGTPTVSASATEPSIGTYAISASWTAVANATGYRATVTRSGTTLSSATLTKTSWTTKVAASPGQQVVVSVKAVIGHRAGKAGTKSLDLTDQITPSGSYHSTFVTDTGAATLVQDSLADDSPVSEIVRTVNWGDGHTETWASGQTTLNHTYALTPARYVPTVKLQDLAGHSVTESSTGVVVLDDTAPTGTFVTDRSAAWAKFTPVTVTQTALHDNWSPNAAIARLVAWGDGTTTAWTKGTTISHVYSTAGTYTPKVTLTDEAGNGTAPISAPPAVVVTADTVAPKVTLTLPTAKHSVRAWKVLRGKATDAQTGVKSVWLKAVEKRAGAWFGYNAKTRTWVRATTKAKAFRKAVAFTRHTNLAHVWKAKLVRLRRGTLVYKVRATDNVGNHSATLTHRATLTKP